MAPPRATRQRLCGHAVLVSLAARLPCVYPRDDCDKHRDEDGFTRCPMCVVRDLAKVPS